MKKLLMLGAILVLGATAFAKGARVEDPNQSEANVTVKAQLVAENLVISDLEGNPLVLDFKKINVNQDTGIRQAEEGLLVRYVGQDKLNAGNSLKMELKGDNGFVNKAVGVTLSALAKVEGKEADTFDVNVGLDSYTGKLTEGTGYDTATYEGMVRGTLDFTKANPTSDGKSVKFNTLAHGDYEGHTVLKVTLTNPTV